MGNHDDWCSKCGEDRRERNCACKPQKRPKAALPKTGADLIAEERLRQMTKEGWTAEHDDGHRPDEMALAAACYAIPDGYRHETGPLRRGNAPWLWPWETHWWKPSPRNRIRELAKAGALIAAEIDLLLRDETGKEEGK